MEDWNNPEHARKWSADPVSHNPTRPEQLDILVSLLADEYREGEAVLDIGMGSGLVEEMLFERIPGVRVVGLDASEAMLSIAHERLAPYRGRYEVVVGDLTQIGDVNLPDLQVGVVISVQVIHNVEDRYKREVISFAHRALRPGGLFLWLDRVRVGAPGLFDVYSSLWKRLDRLHGSGAAEHEGATFSRHEAIVSTRGDLPGTLEGYLGMMREAGFEAACLHLHGNRALLAGRKGAT